MKTELKQQSPTTHQIFPLIWCTLGFVAICAIAVISYWLKKCSETNYHGQTYYSNVDHHQYLYYHQYQHRQQHQQFTSSFPSAASQQYRAEQQQQEQQYYRHEQSHPAPQPPPPPSSTTNNPQPSSSSTTSTSSTSNNPVTILVHKTINSVLQNSRKIIFRVCDVTHVKRKFKMFNLYSTMNRRNDEKEAKEIAFTGHDRFCQERPSRSSYRKKRKRRVRRARSLAEFETSTYEQSQYQQSSLQQLSQQQPASIAATTKRFLFRGRSVSSEQDTNSETEHSERSPLVSAKLDSLAKFIFSRSLQQQQHQQQQQQQQQFQSQDASCSGGSSPTRSTIKYQYTALDSGIGTSEISPRERAVREKAENACQKWLQSTGRYELLTHLPDIGSRHTKNWFLLKDGTTRTDRLMTLISIPPDCVALEESPSIECPKGVMMELLGSLQHPYIYPILDLGFLQHTETHNYACLVMPFNPRGSLKDLIFKAQWNEPCSRKYVRKAMGLPISQVQRLGRQILEALLFLRERGIVSHGHLHSGNVIIQNGVARLSGIENGLLGLNSRVNAIVWAQCAPEVENIDIICFGHLLFEMCTGYELPTPQPTQGHLQLGLERHPQVAEILQLIFYNASEGRYPKLEDLVMCDIFRNIDLREMRGTCIPAFKYGLSSSTMSLLNAVRKRQGASLGGSHSEGSSPCTPPSTPRKLGDHDISTSEISSDSEALLDEVVITSTSMDNLKYYNPLYSPIHVCDNTNNSFHRHHRQHPSTDDSASTIIRVNSMEAEELVSSSTTSQQTLAPSSAYKNSKSRRMEYSMRGTKLGVSNPSQDSAFGSMTDGELSRASSFKLSSFQSVSSPIDEGVEELDQDHLKVSAAGSVRYIDSSTNSSPCRSIISSRDPSPQPMPEPPKLVINDQSCNGSNQFIYTSSPIRKCATTEVFSQKYRVSSFEDMSTSANRLIASFGKKSFKSLEEESSPEGSPARRAPLKEKNTQWKSSVLSRKNNLIKSTESFFESCSSMDQPEETEKLLESPSRPTEKSRKFKLSKLKQTPIQDSLDLEEYHETRNMQSTTTKNNKKHSNSSSDSSICKSLSHTDIQKFITDSNIEENTPLLDEMELSPISPPSDD